MFRINLAGKIYIDKKKLLRRLGHSQSNRKISRSFDALLNASIELAVILAMPQQIINISGIEEITEYSVKLEKGFVIKSRKVAELLKDCEKVISFLVTIGPRLEDKRDYSLETNEPTQALLLDACGSEAVEELAEKLNASSAKSFRKKGYSATSRYSPGYGDWDISAQEEFLKFLGADKIGVSLNEKYIMSPEKSISGVIGLKKGLKGGNNG